ncbi:MAG: M15 family metallopeptidase [Gammaproteobacteria bacterium]|nr:M15 family metallopeptidase [Gammaproteobacteria bacterium]
MRLSRKQRDFTKALNLLLTWAHAQGYEFTLGDAYRSPRVKWHYGHPDSYHKRRLAIDLHLFIDGQYQRTTEAHRPIGEMWERLGGTWGGRFINRPDGNHYSWGELR